MPKNNNLSTIKEEKTAEGSDEKNDSTQKYQECVVSLKLKEERIFQDVKSEHLY